MLAFEVVFPEVAREYRAITTPAGVTLVFRELYCNEPRCDCRRVMLMVTEVASRRVAATISYGFEPPEPPHDQFESQVFLDPINPQGEQADELLDLFLQMIETDRGYHDRLVRHYEMWKRVVDDPAHPLHRKARGKAHDDPAFTPAFPRKPAVEAYAPCPCGSGKKYKFCCRDAVTAGAKSI